MKKILITVSALMLSGCASQQFEKQAGSIDQPCLGSYHLPEHLANQFEAVSDKQLLNESLGKPRKGKLCQARVYRSNADSRVTIYRAWNSTNPRSKFGNWWAFQIPSGKISTYRADYEICYQWSPLDMLVSCTLRPMAKVTVGTGQSAECSKYLTYPVSEAKQIYLSDPATSVTDCKVYTGEFNWK